MNATAVSVLAGAMCEDAGCLGLHRSPEHLPCAAHQILATSLVTRVRAAGYVFSALPVIAPLHARVSGPHAGIRP